MKLPSGYSLRLLRASALAAIVITKAFSTCSTEAVVVLATLLAADLRAKELAASRSLKADWPLTTFSECRVTYAKKIIPDAGLQAHSTDQLGLAFDSSLAPCKPLHFLLHQAKPKCNIAMLAENVHTLHIFTAGSKSDSNAGYAATIVNQFGIIQKLSGGLPAYATAYEAEAVAIYVGLTNQV